MSDRSALMAAVLAAPDDDVPRLVYADYLDDTGDPVDAARAEFIRLEVEADRFPTGAAERQELDARAAVLFRKHIAEWNRDLPGWLGKDARVFYRRGFPHELEAEYERFASSAFELFEAAPIRAVQLTAARLRSEFEWSSVRRPECLGRVVRLGLSPAMSNLFDPLQGGYGPPRVFELCWVPYFSGLRVLDVGTAGVNDDWVYLFAVRFQAAAFAHTLNELLMPDNHITDAGAQALAAAKGLDRLTRIDLRNNRMSKIGIGPLQARFGDRLVV